MFNAILNRLRVFAFGISVAIMGLWNPSKTLQAVYKVLEQQDF